MSKIRIRNFGPIKAGLEENDGWLEIAKATAFIGNQGSGKSTVAKLISTFLWIEKALVRGDYPIKWFERRGRFKNTFLEYHRLENYLNDDNSEGTMLEFEGEAYSISYSRGFLSIREMEHASYPLPQIMYVPAERNFIAYVKKPNELRLSSKSMLEFITEFENAKSDLKIGVALPINNVDIEYDRLNDVLNLKGNGYKIGLSESSSGFQSLVPLFMVSTFLAESVNRNDSPAMSTEEMQRFKRGVDELWSNSDLTDEQRRVALSSLAGRFNKTSFVNIVEEPEQNLFPTSQWQMLQSLLKINNKNVGNRLILTTHSPYIINFLSIAILGHEVSRKIEENGSSAEVLNRLNNIVDLDAVLPSEDVVIYQLDETRGSIKKLESTYGIPTDRNALNSMLRAGNQMFDQLLEIEEELKS